MEVEAKFRALNRIRASAVEQIDWTPYRLGERVVHILHDTLLDDDRRSITGSRHALRVRNDGLHVYLTFKGPGTTEGATHRREEIETLIDPAVADTPQAWPALVRERVAALAGDMIVEPIVEVHNKRRAWEVWQGARLVAELALDDGEIEAAERRMPLHEIELELKGEGTEEDLATLAQRLQHALALAAEPRSKLARGLELLEAASTPKAPAVAMTPTANLAEAGRGVLGKHWRKFLKNEQGAREGDMEAVHDMRVATRRLRAMLLVLADVYDEREVSRLRKGLRRVAASLGVVRDAEVWLAAVDEYAAGRAPEERAGLDALTDALVERRDTGRRELIRELESGRTRRLRRVVQSFVDEPGAGVRPDSAQLRVRDRAGSALWARYEAVRAFEPVMPVAPVEVLHELRIAGKYLRYTFELFEDALDEDAQALHAELVGAQDHLGALHDADVAMPFVAELIEEHPDNKALRGYHAYLEGRAREERANSEGAWETLNSASFRERLAAILSGL
jgi:triphosphatase